MRNKEWLDRRFRRLEEFSYYWEKFTNDRERRNWAAKHAKEIGYGGITAISQRSGLSRQTIAKGMAELSVPGAFIPAGRIRKPGGGRKPKQFNIPELEAELSSLLEPLSGSAVSQPVCRLDQSLRQLTLRLKQRGFEARPDIVSRILRSWGYENYGNGGRRDQKMAEADLDAVNQALSSHLEAGDLVVLAKAVKKWPDGCAPARGLSVEEAMIDIVRRLDTFRKKSGHINSKGWLVPYVIWTIAKASRNQLSPDALTIHALRYFREWWYRRGGKKFFPNAKRLLMVAFPPFSAKLLDWKDEKHMLEWSRKSGCAVQTSHILPCGTYSFLAEPKPIASFYATSHLSVSAAPPICMKVDLTAMVKHH